MVAKRNFEIVGGTSFEIVGEQRESVVELLSQHKLKTRRDLQVKEAGRTTR